MPQADEGIQTRLDGRDAAGPSDARSCATASCAPRGCGMDPARGLETRRCTAASCIDAKGRERKRSNSSSPSLLGRERLRARAVPGDGRLGVLWCRSPGPAQTSSAAAFPYGSVDCLPVIVQQHLTAHVHPPPGPWVTRTMMVSDSCGYVFLREQKRYNRSTSQVAWWYSGSSHWYSPWRFLPARFISSVHILRLFCKRQ